MDKLDGEWYCPLIKRTINNVDCYEVTMSAAGLLKREALFIEFDNDNWAEICDKCPNNPENRLDS